LKHSSILLINDTLTGTQQQHGFRRMKANPINCSLMLSDNTRPPLASMLAHIPHHNHTICRRRRDDILRVFTLLDDGDFNSISYYQYIHNSMMILIWIPYNYDVTLHKNPSKTAPWRPTRTPFDVIAARVQVLPAAWS
jgi:hypothetical protein